jgi:hypothetical protein
MAVETPAISHDPHSPRVLPAHACTPPPPAPPPPLTGQTERIVWRSEAEHSKALKGSQSDDKRKRKRGNVGQDTASGGAKNQKVRRMGVDHVGGHCNGKGIRNTDRGVAPPCQNQHCVSLAGQAAPCANNGYKNGLPQWKTICDRCVRRKRTDPDFVVALRSKSKK